MLAMDRTGVRHSRVEPLRLVALLLAVALAMWLLLIERMAGMDQGPGTDLGGLGWFIGVWVTMMAAMMLPSVAPMVLLFARVSRQRVRQRRAAVTPWVFVGGYLTIWTVFGLVAYGVYAVVEAVGGGVLAWDRGGRWVAGGAVVAAGLYQLTPLKSLCLRHCRGPLHFLLHGWREGRSGAVRMGVEHGAYCVGCCVGLMLILIGVGAMNLTVMLVLAGVILLEKYWTRGVALSRITALAAFGLAVFVLAFPQLTGFSAM